MNKILIRKVREISNIVPARDGKVRGWQRWAPYAAVVWSLLYAALGIYWAAGGRGFPYTTETASDSLGPLLGRFGSGVAWIVVILAGTPAAVMGTAMLPAVDLPAPVTAAWACDAGEEPGGEARLDLEVQSGKARELRVVVFLDEPDGLVTLSSYSTHDLLAGPMDLTVEVTEVPVGALDGFVTGTEHDVVSARLVDLETGVLLPPLPTTASGGGFHFATTRLPRGRFFGLSLELTGGCSWRSRTARCTPPRARWRARGGRGLGILLNASQTANSRSHQREADSNS